MKKYSEEELAQREFGDYDIADIDYNIGSILFCNDEFYECEE